MAMYLLNKQKFSRIQLAQVDANRYCRAITVEILASDIEALNSVGERDAKQQKLLNLAQNLLGKTGNDKIEINMVLTQLTDEAVLVETFVFGLILGQLEQGFNESSLGMKLVIGIFDKGVQVENFELGEQMSKGGGFWKFEQNLETALARKFQECCYSVTLTLRPVSPLLPEIDNKVMLEKEFLCDTGIVCKNGVIVGCHKYILSTNSRFYLTFFRNHPRAGTISDLDLSIESVNAMLKFLYYGSVNDIDSNIDVALELLNVASKKKFSTLMEYLIKFLMDKNIQLFNIDQGVQLFTKTQDVPDYDSLKKKAVEVIRAKANSEELKNSREFKALLGNDYEMGMQLVMCLSLQRSGD